MRFKMALDASRRRRAGGSSFVGVLGNARKDDLSDVRAALGMEEDKTDEEGTSCQSDEDIYVRALEVVGEKFIPEVLNKIAGVAFGGVILIGFQIWVAVTFAGWFTGLFTGDKAPPGDFDFETTAQHGPGIFSGGAELLKVFIERVVGGI